MPPKTYREQHGCWDCPKGRFRSGDLVSLDGVCLIPTDGPRFIRKAGICALHPGPETVQEKPWDLARFVGEKPCQK